MSSPTPFPDGEDASERLRAAGDAIVHGVETELETWAVAHVIRILDAWGQADAETRAGAVRDAHRLGRAAAIATAGDLRALFALDVAEQNATPLEIVRRAISAPTAALEAVGVPPVARDEFTERAFPDDRYDFTPRTLDDLGDESLAPLQLAWGMAKAAVLRSRATSSEWRPADP